MSRQLFITPDGYIIKDSNGNTTTITANSFNQNAVDVSGLTPITFSEFSADLQNMIENLDTKLGMLEADVDTAINAFE